APQAGLEGVGADHTAALGHERRSDSRHAQAMVGGRRPLSAASRRARPRRLHHVRGGAGMKIVQAVGWYFPDSLAGTEVYGAGLCRRLRDAGQDVLVAAPDSAASAVERSYEHDGIPVYRYPIPPAPTRAEVQGTVRVRGAERFHRWLAAQRPDVV